MNKLFTVFALVASLGSGSVGHASEVSSVSHFQLAAVRAMTVMNLIDWKVGDTANYNVGMGMMGQLGTMVQSVTQDQGDALWMRQDLDLKFQKQTVDVLLSKADGRILKLLVNGKEQQIPENDLEIIEQNYTEITVPAGTFQVIHIVAKTKQVSKIEIWANPVEAVMDGTIKNSTATGFGDMVMELTSFTRMP